MRSSTTFIVAITFLTSTTAGLALPNPLALAYPIPQPKAEPKPQFGAGFTPGNNHQSQPGPTDSADCNGECEGFGLRCTQYAAGAFVCIEI